MTDHLTSGWCQPLTLQLALVTFLTVCHLGLNDLLPDVAPEMQLVSVGIAVQQKASSVHEACSCPL